MKNIPTKDELIGYLKKGKKIIILTMSIFVVLYIILLSYSIYSSFTDIREEEEQFLAQADIVDILEREPEEVSAGDIRNIENALEQDRYAFGVLIEREDQTFYNHPRLITEFLISEEVVAFVEERAGRELLPSSELAVEVSEDSNTRILEIVIGTADVDDNAIFAQAYYEAVQEEGLIAPFEDKAIYMMDSEPFLVETETWMDLVLEQIQFVSPLRAVIGFIVMLILGFIAGIIIVLFKTMVSKEIPFMYELKHDDSDTVLYFNQMKGISEEEKYMKLAHAVNTFPHKKKIILSQEKMHDKFTSLTENLIDDSNQNEMVSFTDFSESPVTIECDEVIILVEQNKSTKDWYKNQRIQLDRINVPVTILNF